MNLFLVGEMAIPQFSIVSKEGHTLIPIGTLPNN